MRVRFSCQASDQGILWSIGEQIGGMVLYVEDGALRFYYNGFGEHSTLPAVPLAAGDHEAVLDYEATGKRQGRGRLLLDGKDSHRLERPLTNADGRVPRGARHRARPSLPGELADLREAPLVSVHWQDRGRDHRAG